jgi:uncharacterized protein
LRIFLDANIVFLAGYSARSPVHDLLALARSGACDLVTSSYALEEARRNLAVKGPNDWLTRLNDATDVVEVVGEAQPAALQVAELVSLSDPSDVPILAAAIQSRREILISGDRRAFGTLFGSRVGNLEVLTLRDVLLRVLGDRT